MSQSLTQSYTDLLSRIALFEHLDRITLAKLAAHLEVVHVAQGEIVFREGDPGDAFYLVIDGFFSAYAASQDKGQQTLLYTFGAGEPFGDMALITNRPRSATIQADTAGEVFRLERSRFIELTRQEPAVLLAVATTLSDHVLQINAQLSGKPIPAQTEATALEPTEEQELISSVKSPPLRSGASRVILGSGLAVMAGLAGWFVPPPADLPTGGWHALITLLASIPLLALGALPEGILALLLSTAWVVVGVAPTPIALSGFASASWVLVVSVLAVGTGISSSGLLYRLGLWTVAHTRGGFLGQVLALSVAGVLTGPAIPNALGRMSLIAPALTDMVEALGYAPKSRGAAGLAMAAFVGFGQMTATFLTSSTTALLIIAVLPASISGGLDWVSWMIRAAPANAFLFLGLIVSILWFYGPRTAEEKAVRGRSGLLEVQRALLGPLSRNERLSFIVGVALLLGFITQPLHGIHPAWISVFALTVLALTGVVTTSTLRMVNWNFVLLFGTLASLSKVLSHTQFDLWFGHLVVDTVGVLTGTPIVFVAALTVLCFVVSFVLRWPAAASLLTIALAPVAGAAGINPLIVGLVALIACNTFFLPYQSSVYLALYHGTGGALFHHTQARPAALAYALITLIALCASVPAWQAMGLL